MVYLNALLVSAPACCLLQTHHVTMNCQRSLHRFSSQQGSLRPLLTVLLQDSPRCVIRCMTWLSLFQSSDVADLRFSCCACSFIVRLSIGFWRRAKGSSWNKQTKFCLTKRTFLFFLNSSDGMIFFKRLTFYLFCTSYIRNYGILFLSLTIVGHNSLLVLLCVSSCSSMRPVSLCLMSAVWVRLIVVFRVITTTPFFFMPTYCSSWYGFR